MINSFEDNFLQNFYDLESPFNLFSQSISDDINQKIQKDRPIPISKEKFNLSSTNFSSGKKNESKISKLLFSCKKKNIFKLSKKLYRLKHPFLF